MSLTRSSLLSRVRDLGSTTGWAEFDRLYRPLLIRYARCRGMSRDDAEDIAQQCFEVIISRIGSFHRETSFRGWLWRIANNKVKQVVDQRETQKRGNEALVTTQPGHKESHDVEWSRQWDEAHVAFMLEDVRANFAPHTVSAFESYVLKGIPVAEISRRLGMSANQVYVAKSRIISFLRTRHRELLESLYCTS